MNSTLKIRLFVLLFGVGVLSLALLFDVKPPKDLAELAGILLFYGWNVLPSLLYFLLTQYVTARVYLIVPGALLCLLQLFFVTMFLASSDGQAVFIFIVLPVYSFVALGGSVFLIGLFRDGKALIEKVQKIGK